MALGEASVEIIPDLSRFMGELQRGISDSMARVERVAESAGESVQQSFEEASRQSEQALRDIADGDPFSGVERDAEQAGERVERSFREAARQSDAKLKGIGSGFGKIAGGIGAALAGVGLTQFLSGAALDAQAANSALANTAQLIESTGGKAGVTQAQIESLADSLMLEVGIDDTAVIEASNALLTFTQVSGPIFDETITRAADLSAVFGTDLQGATMQLGKALNDPVRGLTALSRSGVSFTAEQKEMIKGMVEAGDTAGAQRLILDELAVQFGGTAAASADSTAKISAAMGEVKESIGQGLIGAIDSLAPVLISTFQSLEEPLATVGEGLGDALGTVIEAVGPVLPVIADAFGKVLENLGTVFEAFAPAIEPLANILSTIADVTSTVLAGAFEAIAPAVTAFVDAISVIVETVGPIILEIFQAVAPVIQRVAQAFSGQLAKILPIIVGLIEQMAPIFVQIAEVMMTVGMMVMDTLLPPLSELVTTVLAAMAPVLPQIAEAFLQIVEALIPLIPPLLEIVVALLPPLTDLLVAIIPLFGQMAEILAAGLAAAIGLITPLIEKLAGAITKVVEWIGKLVTWVADAITSFTNWLSNWRETLDMIGKALGDALPKVLAWFRELPGKILSAIGNLGQTLWQKAQDLIGGLLTGINNAWEAVKGWLGDIARKVVSAVGNLLTTLRDTGRDIIIGLWNGMKAVWETVTGWLGSFAERVVRGLGNIADVLVEIGKKIIDGLWRGMKATWSSVSGWLGGLGGWIVDLKGPPAKDAVLLYRNGQLIMEGLQDGMESGFQGVRSFLRNANDEIASSIGSASRVAIPMPGLGGVDAPTRLSIGEIAVIFGNIEQAERELTLGNRTLASYAQLLMDSIGQFEVYSDEYMRIYSLLSRTQDELVAKEEARSAREFERIKNRYEATGRGSEQYLALLKQEQAEHRKWSSEWMAIENEMNALRDTSIDRAYAEAEAARDVAEAVEAQTEARREYLTVVDPQSEATDDEKKRAGMAYAQSIYERLQAKAAKKGVPDRSVRWARFMRKRLIDIRDSLDGKRFKFVRDGLDRILLGIPDLEKVEDDTDPTSGMVETNPVRPNPAPAVPTVPGARLSNVQRVVANHPMFNAAGRSQSMGPAVNIENATFQDATDAELVAQKVYAAVAIRSMS